MRIKSRIVPMMAAVCTAALLATAVGGAQQPAAGAPAAQTGAGPAVTPPFDDALDTSLSDACGGRSKTPMVACQNDVNRMVRALPAKAPATPARARKILVLGTSRGFQHSSIPLAASMIEEMGKKTGAWTTDISYDRASISAENLKQYDAVFLSSTTGTFLDEPNPNNDPAVQAKTDARRKAFMEFVRGGKGVIGIHAATDAYHGRVGGGGGRAAAPAAGRAGAPAAGAPAGARGGGRGQQPAPEPCSSAQTQGATAGGDPLWPEYNKMIGGWFKHHWNYPTPITVKIDDPSNPINAAFKGKSFNTIDEVYTFNHASFSRDNVRVLTSVDYSLMSDCDKGLESNRRPDGDYALSYIRKEGNGRMFYQALGHHESIYYNNPAMLEHLLAGVQYALGDLKADDTPRPLTK